MSAFRIVLAVALCGCTLPFFAISWHWPLVGDASLIHYICFLMDHGMAPYRDLGDMNMPAAFMLEWAAMHGFGGGDVAWRLFDFFVLGVAAAAIGVITWRRDWLAGVFAACLLILIHGRDGFAQSGQRDLVLAVSLLLATAMLFAGVRRNKPWLAGLFGLFAGLGGALKPTALPLAVVLLGLAAVALRRRDVRQGAFVSAALVGLLVAPLASLGFLVREHALGAFVTGLRTVVPFYVSLGHRPLGFLLLHSVSPVLPLVGIWVATMLLERPRLDFERGALLAGALFGLASYVVQARGFPYYRYTLLVFLLPLMGVDLVAALDRWRPGARGDCARWAAAVGLAMGALLIAPMSIVAMSRFDPGSIDFISSLEQNLERLGGSALSGNVQCIDSVSGCGTTLYRMRLVQATGVLSDFLLFGKASTPSTARQAPVVEETRVAFAEAMRVHPPRVIVVTSWLHIDGPGGYEKLARWPAFRDFLASRYTLETQWTPTRPELWWSRPVWSNGYRVYVLKLGGPETAVRR